MINGTIKNNNQNSSRENRLLFLYIKKVVQTNNQIDKLNDGERRSVDYEEYFGDMELTEEEKDERIKLAERFEIIFLFFFLQFSNGESMDYASMIYEKYTLVALEFLKVVKTTEYLEKYARKLSEEIVRVTVENESDEYYTSKDRAMLISENEANSMGNYRQQIEAVKSGKKYKTWVTEKDNRVRHTHREVDDKTIGIFEQFQVGNSLMMFPKSSEGSPEETCGCRCTLKYS